MNGRLHYLDNLRVFLTGLVLYHHTAITYGAAGSWYYVERPIPEAQVMLLTLVAAVNQSFFMGLFFFIAGYFTPPSYDRKGAAAFWRDRLLRLGLPLVAYVFAIGPAPIYALDFRQQSFLDFYRGQILSLRIINIGPLWFLQALLLFSLGYAICRGIAAGSPWSKAALPFSSNRALLGAALLLGLAAFAVRLAVPAGAEVFGLQLGYFPSYVLLFAAGALAYRQGWLDRLAPAAARLWLKVSLAAIPFLAVVAVLIPGDGYAGGLNIQALVYAMWEPFVAFGLCLYLLWWFKERCNAAGPWQGFLSRRAYTVYIIHPLVIVGLSLTLGQVGLHPALKLLIVWPAGVAICFFLSGLILKIPYARRIL